MSELNLKALSKKFPEEDIEWRIQQEGSGSKGGWALVIPYITNRAIMQRLDDTVGPGKWKNEFKATPCNTGYQCGISIKIDGEWVTRWDGSEMVGAGSIDKVKSTMSSAMKRTGVQWGIGRYLYQFEVAFANVIACDSRYKVKAGFTFHENKKKNTKFQWAPPKIEAWALPLSPKEINVHIKTLKEVKNLDELRFAWQVIYKVAVSESDDDVMTRLVSAKNAAKDRIAQEQEEQINGDTAKLEGWVNKQVSAFEMVPNESSVTSLKDNLIEQLKLKAKNTAVDVKPLIITITNSYNDRINQFK